jgi:hypothetical protein
MTGRRCPAGDLGLSNVRAQVSAEFSAGRHEVDIPLGQSNKRGYKGLREEGSDAGFGDI